MGHAKTTYVPNEYKHFITFDERNNKTTQELWQEEIRHKPKST